MHAGDRYRTVSEASILDMCHLAGWACESGEGSPGRARTREALEHWIALGLGVRRDADGGRYFDPCEVLNFVKQAGLDGRDAFWSERVVGTARQLVVDMRNDDPHQFTVELRRTFNTRSLPAGAALRLRMPLPLTSDHLGDLEVHPHAAAAGAHVAVSRGAEAWIDGQGWMPFDFSRWELSRGGQDPAWRDYFFGRIDCRLTNQCLPLDFTGAVGVKIPAAWHIQQSAQPVGVAVGLFDVEGKLVCRDFVAVVG